MKNERVWYGPNDGKYLQALPDGDALRVIQTPGQWVGDHLTSIGLETRIVSGEEHPGDAMALADAWYHDNAEKLAE